MAVPDYTTADRLAKRVSQLGVDLRADHDPDDATAEAIGSASADVVFFCWRYDPDALSQSDWAAKVATDLAVYYLCALRLNPVPKTVELMYERAYEQLTKVQDGKAVVPDAPAGRGGAPTVTNQRVVLDRYPNIRTERPRSTGVAKGYRRRTDPGAERIDSG
jgi:hypothetical protein